MVAIYLLFVHDIRTFLVIFFFSIWCKYKYDRFFAIIFCETFGISLDFENFPPCLIILSSRSREFRTIYLTQHTSWLANRDTVIAAKLLTAMNANEMKRIEKKIMKRERKETKKNSSKTQSQSLSTTHHRSRLTEKTNEDLVRESF
uniref:(northern house mosquito) hypothetical protein n=1 Tax=Culex pipiens TaxID=7175 RepID=A0A8D8CAL8_CULPI